MPGCRCRTAEISSRNGKWGSTMATTERFIVYFNAAGQPVHRSLEEMTAGEVIQALNWHIEEAERLDREAEPARKMFQEFEAGTRDPHTVPPKTLIANDEAL